MNTNLIRIHPSDSVAVALTDLETGDTADCSDIKVTLTEDIPFGHKVALKSIAKNVDV